MKRRTRNALIAGGFAICGVVATLSSSLALYLKKPDDHKINIGVATSGDMELTVGSLSWSTGSLNPENNLTLSYSLGATLGASSKYKQDVVVGELKVTVKTKNEDMYKKLNVSNSLTYNAGTYFDTVDAYHDLKNLHFPELADRTEAAVSEWYSISATMNAAVAVTGTAANLTLSLTGVSAEDFLDKGLAEDQLKITIEFKENRNYNFAYVKGLDDVWSATDAGRMVPNINGTDWEWMWKADKNYTATTGWKCWIDKDTPTGTDTWETGSDNHMDAITTGKTIYWKGGSNRATVS